MSGPPRFLPALATARFVAALQVVLFHCTAWRTWEPSALKTVAATGYIAVAFFFVLSGFILTYTYWEPLRGPIARRAFYSARFARIYPTYALALLVALPFFAKGALGTGELVVALRDGLLSVTLLQAHVPGAALSWNPPGWSLSTEAFFYLLFPLLLPALSAGTPRRAVLVALGACGLAVGLPLLYVALEPDGLAAPDYDSVATWLDVLRYHPLARLPEFVLGICAARLYLERAELRGPRVGLVLVASGLAVLAVVLMHAERVPYVLLHNGLLAPAFAAVVLGLSAPTRLSRWLSHPGLVLLGEASYALYILHVPLFLTATSLLRRLAPGTSPEVWWFGPTFVVAAVACSVAAFRWIEAPARQRLLRR